MSERRENLFVRQLIHGFASRAFENFAEQDEAEIGINRFRSGRVFQGFPANRGNEFARGMQA